METETILEIACGKFLWHVRGEAIREHYAEWYRRRYGGSPEGAREIATDVLGKEDNLAHWYINEVRWEDIPAHMKRYICGPPGCTPGCTPTAGNPSLIDNQWAFRLFEGVWPHE